VQPKPKVSLRNRGGMTETFFHAALKEKRKRSKQTNHQTIKTVVFLRNVSVFPKNVLLLNFSL